MTTRTATWRRFLSLLLAWTLGLALPTGHLPLWGDEPVKQAPSTVSETGKPPLGRELGAERQAAKPVAPPLRNSPTSAEDLAAIQTAIQQAVAKGLPATVGITIRGTFGSGVVVTEDGYILTAGHVAAVPGAMLGLPFPMANA